MKVLCFFFSKKEVLASFKPLRRGGVLSVVAVRPDGVVLSWAGGATAAGAQNYQADGAEMLLAQNDYATLLDDRSKKH